MKVTHGGESRPVQCPFCDAHGRVTLVTTPTANGAKFDWHCNNCEHHWSAIQPVDPHSSSVKG
jgi:formate dehydrogenase maturation protein FdhE